MCSLWGEGQSEDAVKGLDEVVLGGFAWLDMVEVPIAPLSPGVECLAGELGTIVTGDGTWCSHRVAEGIEQIIHSLPSDGGIHME